MNVFINEVVNTEKEIADFFSTRSRFYNIEPIGIGTPYVESLSSYISRISLLHNVSLSNLLKIEVSPFFSREYIREELLDSNTKSSMYINENSIITLDYVNAIEALTGRKDLINLTMLNWSGIFLNNLRSKCRRWCPICLSEMAAEPNNIYEPLIWYLNSLQTCDIHKIALKEKCPSCNRSLPFLHSKFKVGYCQYCDCFLGNDTSFCDAELSEYEEFLILNFKELIENTAFTTAFPTKISISNLLTRIIKEAGFNTKSDFANFIGYNPGPVCGWIKSFKLPNYLTLLDIARKFNCSIYEMIYNEDIKFTLNVQIDEPIKRENTPLSEIEFHLKLEMNLNNPKRIDILANEIGFSVYTAKKHFPLLYKEYKDKYLLCKNKIRIAKQYEIEKILNECLDKSVPISLAKCLEENDLSYKVVKRISPELCSEVSERYKNYISNSKKERIKFIISEIKALTLEIHNSGIYPSRERVEKQLGSVVFLEKEIREGWKQIMFELGYNLDK